VITYDTIVSIPAKTINAIPFSVIRNDSIIYKNDAVTVKITGEGEDIAELKKLAPKLNVSVVIPEYKVRLKAKKETKTEVKEQAKSRASLYILIGVIVSVIFVLAIKFL